jgi:hypothetical protein
VRGEDITFCRRWWALGGRVFADPGFRLAHFGERCFSMALHEAEEPVFGMHNGDSPMPSVSA